MTSPQEQHADVGAYALGLLDDADATRFETHLAGCELCMAELDSLAGLEPLLAEYAAATPTPARSFPFPTAPTTPCSAGCSTRSPRSAPGRGAAGCSWSRRPPS